MYSLPRLLAGLLVVLALPASAQSPCPRGIATADLDAGNVRARLYNDGALFWHGAGNVYNVPKTEPGKPIAPNAIFAGSLMTGGLVNGVLHQTAATYSNWEFIPGPLDAQGQPPFDCASYDRIAGVETSDLGALQQGVITDAVRNWPWRWGAPVVDGDGVAGNYNLAGGDRPELLGTQTRWWVMNAMGAHPRTGSAPFPLEVQVTASASASVFPAVNNATLYRYRFVWRGTVPITEFYGGLYLDVDLGNASDDYVGTDSARAMVYGYNADEFDEGSDGYGARPPAIGLMVLTGTGAATQRTAHTARVAYKGASREPTANSDDHYDHLRGLFITGQVMYRCGDAYAPQYASCGPTRFTFTGVPERGEGWTMETPLPSTTPLAPSDFRMMASVGPLTLQPGESYEAVFVLPWARGADRLDALARLREAADVLYEVWRSNGFSTSTFPFTPPPVPKTALGVGTPVPNPARDIAWLTVGLPDETRVQVDLYGMLGQTLLRVPAAVLSAGTHQIPLDVSGLAPGVYRVRVSVKGQTVTRSLVVVR